MTAQTLAFDVYGTLVDPLEMGTRLAHLVGRDKAAEMAAVWRQKQLEYSFRRGLMGQYVGFSRCTAEALDYAQAHCAVTLSAAERQSLLDAYQALEPFPEVAQALETLKRQGHTLVAFSNGEAAPLRELLSRGELLERLDGVISVEAVQSFKPDPRVYQHLTTTLQARPEQTWLISSNPFDILGAQAVGLRTAWVKRRADALFDPWSTEPDQVVADLSQLASNLQDLRQSS